MITKQTLKDGLYKINYQTSLDQYSPNASIYGILPICSFYCVKSYSIPWSTTLSSCLPTNIGYSQSPTTQNYFESLLNKASNNHVVGGVYDNSIVNFDNKFRNRYKAASSGQRYVHSHKWSQDMSQFINDSTADLTTSGHT